MITAATEEKGAAAEVAAPVPAPKREPAYTIGPNGERVRKLVKPIKTHTGDADTITLRRPKYRDIMNFGDPEIFVVVDGGYVPQIDMAQIEKYIVALSGMDAGLLEQVDYVDALALRDAVRSFFQ